MKKFIVLLPLLSALLLPTQVALADDVVTSPINATIPDGHTIIDYPGQYPITISGHCDEGGAWYDPTALETSVDFPPGNFSFTANTPSVRITCIYKGHLTINFTGGEKNQINLGQYLVDTYKWKDVFFDNTGLLVAAGKFLLPAAVIFLIFGLIPKIIKTN